MMYKKKIGLSEYSVFNKKSHLIIKISNDNKFIYIKNDNNGIFFVIDLSAITSTTCIISLYNNETLIIKSKNRLDCQKVYTLLKARIKSTMNPYVVITYLKGLGYHYDTVTIEKKINKLITSLNYSNKIQTKFPKNIYINIHDNLGVFSSYNKEILLKYIKNFQKLRYPDYYKNKGIHIYGELYFLKSSK